MTASREADVETMTGLPPVTVYWRPGCGFCHILRRELDPRPTRLANSQTRLVGLLGGTLTAQVARLLLDEADRDGRIALSQATLAAMLGARRPSVNKVLGELAGAGLIDVAYRSIRVVDRARLAALA